MTSLYAQLESLTTTVAQLRRDAPGRAAREYAAELGRVIEEEDREVRDDDEDENDDDDDQEGGEGDVKMQEADANPDEAGAQAGTASEAEAQAKSGEAAADTNTETGTSTTKRGRIPSSKRKESAQWKLDIPLGTEQEAERWRNGEIAEAYEDTLRTLLRLQGEAVPGDNDDRSDDALASTVGKAERAVRAVEFVEKK